MTLNVAFTSGARADIRDIAEFSVERFGSERARVYIRELRAACKRLGDFPEMAPVFHGVRPLARCLVHRSHRIFYRVERERILILRILHHAQDTPSDL